MGELKIEKLCIRYGMQAVIQDLDLSVADGEMVSLLGPSGAGKTTILKAVAGLLRPQSGKISIDGRVVDHLAPEKREAVMVFQKPLLFPFMDVAQNIAFGLRMTGRRDRAARREVADILGLTRLKGLAHRRVHELSGGQQQRVSLARALVLKPAILLLDEPLSNLDANLRQQMRDLIQEIQAQTGTTTLFVTHDQAEALMISHRVALLLNGRLRQMGTPFDLFYRPAAPEVARFFGAANFFEGHVNNNTFVSALGEFAVPADAGNGLQRTATIRPEDLVVSAEPNGGLHARVERTNFEGIATRIWMRCGQNRLVALTAHSRFSPGQDVWVTLPADKIRIFPPESP